MNASTSHPEKKDKISATLGPFSLSVLLHATVLLTVGGTVIYDKVILKTPFIAVDDIGGNLDTTVLEPETIESEQMQEPTVSEELSTPVSTSSASGDSTPADILVSTGINNTFSLPPAVGPPSAKIGGTSGLPGSGGTTASSSAPTAKGPGIRTSSIFGQQVESGNFGVIFDVSFSTHKMIDMALEEIERGFPDAIVVLAPGCGVNIAEPRGGVLPGEEYLKQLESLRGGDDKTLEMARFLPRLLEENTRFASMWKKTSADGRMFVCYQLPNLGKDGKSRTGGALINGNILAFDFLIGKDVDTIYWLADFQDGQNASVVQPLAERLKRKRIRVLQHDFDQAPPAPDRIVLATVTGGKVIHTAIDNKGKDKK